ncbi:hypothetical protein SUNI508_03728 [Seiridium unicorne]|uniref:Uncharacterized protein n=1 Tax=Seiridium unicorne TaxID=138068 RepID=A0ABR2VBF9_9PEZI
MGGFYMQYLESLCRRRGWRDPTYECYRDSSGYTCLVLVNGREYQTDLAYESDGLAQENAAMRAFMVCRNFSVNALPLQEVPPQLLQWAQRPPEPWKPWKPRTQRTSLEQQLDGFVRLRGALQWKEARRWLVDIPGCLNQWIHVETEDADL